MYTYIFDLYKLHRKSMRYTRSVELSPVHPASQ